QTSQEPVVGGPPIASPLRAPRHDGGSDSPLTSLRHLSFARVGREKWTSASVSPLAPLQTQRSPQSKALIFRLTRVTRIFQKSVFIEITPAARAGCRAGFFVARTQAAAAQGVESAANR